MIHSELSLQQLLEHISLAGSHDEWAKAVCRVASQLTKSSLTALYKLPHNTNLLALQAKIGHTDVPKTISKDAAFFQAAAGCGGAVVQNSPAGPFQNLLLNKRMQSGIAVLVKTNPTDTAKQKSTSQAHFIGLLIANYTAPYHYTGSTIALFEQVRTLLSYAPRGSTAQDNDRSGARAKSGPKEDRGASEKSGSKSTAQSSKASGGKE